MNEWILYDEVEEQQGQWTQCRRQQQQQQQKRGLLGIKLTAFKYLFKLVKLC